MPIITVIVPVYKVEQYLDRCVESILAQTFTDFELILVDDGSPDNCPQMCDEWVKKDNRISVIHKTNEGVSIARNVALDTARGLYVVFCDSDDYLNRDYLETLYSSMVKTGSDVVCVNYSVVDENGNFIKNPKREFGVVDTFDLDKKYKYIYTQIFGMKHGWEVWTRLFKMDIIRENNIRFPTCCKNYGEDLGFVLEYALHATRIVCVEYAGYNYVLRTGSMMQTSAEIVKLDQMNNLSAWFYPKYEQIFADSDYIYDYPIIHFLFMNIEYGKIIGTDKYKLLGEYISTIVNINWYEKQTKNIKKCRKRLTKYFGKRVCCQILLLSHYCRHKKWKRFTYESALVYNFLIKE